MKNQMNMWYLKYNLKSQKIQYGGNFIPILQTKNNSIIKLYQVSLHNKLTNNRCGATLIDPCHIIAPEHFSHERLKQIFDISIFNSKVKR